MLHVNLVGNPETMEQDDLQELDWVSVPNSPYIMKYKFNDTGYNILVSNLSSLFSEKLSNTDIQDRFCVIIFSTITDIFCVITVNVNFNLKNFQLSLNL